MNYLIWSAVILAVLWFKSPKFRSVLLSGAKQGASVIPKDSKGVKLGPLFWLAAIGVVFFILTYTSLPVTVFEYDWGSTPTGKKLDDEGINPQWLWLIPTGLIFWLFRQKSNKAGDKNPFVQKASFMDNFFLGVLLLASLAFVLVFLWVVLAIAGKDKTLENAIGLTEPERPIAASCLKPSEMELNRDLKIPVGGKKLSICGNGGWGFFLYEPPGYRLEIYFTEKFAKENPEALRVRSEYDFLTISPPMTFIGSTAGSWKVDMINDEFTKSGLPNVEIYVDTIRR